MATATFHPPSTAVRPLTLPSVPMAVPAAPPGTFMPGTKVQVGSHRVVIEKYLSEGGFAHVYVVRVPTSGGQSETAVLKRVAVPDKESLASMRTEVETMKKLRGNKHIVTYIDSHASQLKGGGYEVFLLMEYCDGGGLIDFMNTRLQNRLKEPEILHIISDIAEGVACMHYLKPPLLHRDLKVENVLIATSGISKTYKLCDFGSAAAPRPAATSAAEGKLIEEDVQRHTTLQYRSPEMIDVYRKRAIDEKSDIWALGVLLYKLCYYTTPFETQGQMAILNASFRYPGYPSFSDRLKLLIATMLTEDPQRRPTIYQVLKEISAMRGKDIPIEDIYVNRTLSEVQKKQQLPPAEPTLKSVVPVGAHHEANQSPNHSIPTITPMRRGRPNTIPDTKSCSKPSPSPRRSAATDPFAALDSTNLATRAAAVDELAAKFPALDEFSLLQDKSSRFSFASPPLKAKPEELSKRLTEALADEAFAIPATSTHEATLPSITPSAIEVATSVRKQDLPQITQASPPDVAPSPEVSLERPQYTSTGTMTSHPSSPSNLKSPSQPLKAENSTIFRFPPSSNESSRFSLPRLSSFSKKAVPRERPGYDPVRLNDNTPKSPASSRPSLESLRPPSLAVADSVQRSKSANARSRPSEQYVKAHLPNLRTRSRSRPRSAGKQQSRGQEHSGSAADSEYAVEDSNIPSNADFLRAMEGEDGPREHQSHHRRSSSTLKHIKHTSMPSLSLTGTRNMFAGRFGDAFRKFESANSSQKPPSPERHNGIETDRLTAITGSDRTGSPTLLDEDILDEAEDLPPEVRRELERRRLSQEEKRVAAAAAEYRQRIATDGGTGSRGTTVVVNKAALIQDRVKSLLDESGRASPIKKNAEGYGRYTDNEDDSSNSARNKPMPLKKRAAPNTSNPQPASSPTDLPRSQAQSQPDTSSRYSASVLPSSRIVSGRPSAPPKPAALQTGTTTGAVAMKVPDISAEQSPAIDRHWESNFSKRYPSISLEMVETEIKKEERRPARPPALRVRDV